MWCFDTHLLKGKTGLRDVNSRGCTAAHWQILQGSCVLAEPALHLLSSLKVLTIQLFLFFLGLGAVGGFDHGVTKVLQSSTQNLSDWTTAVSTKLSAPWGSSTLPVLSLLCTRHLEQHLIHRVCTQYMLLNKINNWLTNLGLNEALPRREREVSFPYTQVVFM